MPFELPRRSHSQPQRAELFDVMAKRMPRPHTDLALAVDNCAKEYGALMDYFQRLSKDETKTSGAKLVKLNAALHTRVIPAIEKLDGASRSLGEAVESMASAIRDAYDPPNKGYEVCLRHAEIRTYFRALPSGEALKALEQARNTGNEEVLMALGSAQAFLTGLPEGIVQHTREQIVERKMPGQINALKGLEEQQQLAETFRTALMQSCVDLVDVDRAQEIIANAQEDLTGI